MSEIILEQDAFVQPRTFEQVPLLDVRNISKSFPGVKALDDVSFTLNHGEVLGLCGENGAGKSTLMKVLTGIYEPEQGEVYFNGQLSAPVGPKEAYESGLVIVHQELQLVPDLSVAQNIFMGREHKALGSLTINDRSMNAAAQQLFDRLGLTNINPAARLGDYSIADQQMIEIARALSFDAKVIILDEPTAPLSNDEAAALFRVVRDFVSPTTGVIYISHRLEEVLHLCDDVTVLRDGQTVGSASTTGLSEDQLITMMVGREVSGELRPPDRTPGDVVLKVENLSTATRLHGVNLELRRGEILGLAGLVGAGRTETARAIIGADPITSGDIWVHGAKVNIKNPSDAVNLGIGYLSEDRKGTGLLLEQTVQDNIALSSLQEYTNLGVIDDSTFSRIAEEKVGELRVKTPSTKQLVRNLSGGNQQKVIIARWLLKDCDILVFDEPTRGIDVGAKDEIYTILHDLVAQGKSIIVISSELPEVLRLSDRVAVLADGHVAGILDKNEASPESIMELATQTLKA